MASLVSSTWPPNSQFPLSVFVPSRASVLAVPPARTTADTPHRYLLPCGVLTRPALGMLTRAMLSHWPQPPQDPLKVRPQASHFPWSFGNDNCHVSCILTLGVLCLAPSITCDDP